LLVGEVDERNAYVPDHPALRPKAELSLPIGKAS